MKRRIKLISANNVGVLPESRRPISRSPRPARLTVTAGTHNPTSLALKGGSKSDMRRAPVPVEFQAEGCRPYSSSHPKPSERNEPSSWNQPYVCNIHKSLYSGIRIRTPRTRIMVQQPFVKDVQHELHHVSLVPSPFQHKTRKTYNSNLVEVGKCDNNFYILYSKELHSNLRRDLYAGLQLYTCYKRLSS